MKEAKSDRAVPASELDRLLEAIAGECLSEQRDPRRNRRVSREVRGRGIEEVPCCREARIRSALYHGSVSSLPIWHAGPPVAVTGCVA